MGRHFFFYEVRREEKPIKINLPGFYSSSKKNIKVKSLPVLDRTKKDT